MFLYNTAITMFSKSLPIESNGDVKLCLIEYKQ